MPGKLDALTVRVGSLEARLHETAEAVAENTVITRQIAAHTGALVDMVKTYTDAATTVKTLSSAGKLTAGIAAGAAAVGGAVTAAWHWFRG